MTDRLDLKTIEMPNSPTRGKVTGRKQLEEWRTQKKLRQDTPRGMKTQSYSSAIRVPFGEKQNISSLKHQQQVSSERLSKNLPRSSMGPPPFIKTMEEMREIQPEVISERPPPTPSPPAPEEVKEEYNVNLLLLANDTLVHLLDVNERKRVKECETLMQERDEARRQLEQARTQYTKQVKAMEEHIRQSQQEYQAKLAHAYALLESSQKSRFSDL